MSRVLLIKQRKHVGVVRFGICIRETEGCVSVSWRVYIQESRLTLFVWLVLTIFNEGAYLTFKSIFHKTPNLFKFDCEITLESVPGTNQ